MLNYKFIICIFLVSYQNRLCCCNSDDFQTNVDGFIDAFDDAYSTEISSTTTDEVTVSLGNEIPVEKTVVAEEAVKENEGEPVSEEQLVTETVFQPGSEVKHELGDNVRTLAEQMVNSISPHLKFINITEAFSWVTDKVQRSLSVIVASRECEDMSCYVSCRIELTCRGNVDEVTWHNCLDTANSNEIVRAKRGAIGGFKQVDEAEAMELAEIAAQTLDSIDADDTKRIVTKVIRAQKQLVNGIMYHLTLEVASSDCKEEEEKCEGKLSDHNICKILMQRLFSGEAPRNAQVIKSECTPISKAKELDNRKSQKRAKRHVMVEDNEINTITDHVTVKKTYPQARMVGGRMKQDPNSDKIQEISEFALAEIDKSSNSLNKQKIVRIVDARSQVVAGIKYFLKMELVETDCRKNSDQAECKPANDQVLQSCDVVVWDKPWEKFRTISKVDCEPVQRRSKRQLLGGKKQADPNDARIQEMAQFAVSQLDAKSNSLNSQKLLVVKEAQTQVVAGTNYFLKLQLVGTNCRKGSPVTAECDTAQQKDIQECDVVVYNRPWEKHREMTSANCFTIPSNNKVNKREVLVGGYSPQEKNSDEIKEIANFAVEDVNKKSNSMYKQTLVEVISAKSQVVAGINYNLKLRMAESDCKKGNSVKSAVCAPKPNVVHQECEFTIWDRPWLNSREVTKFSCQQVQQNKGSQQSDGESQRKRKTVYKREVVVGGHTPQDKESEEIIEVAQFAVEDLNKKSNSIYKQTLVEVMSAHSQIVAGLKYHLKLRLADTDCKKSNTDKSAVCNPKENAVYQECDITVWSRPWLNERKVTEFNCKQSQPKQAIAGFDSVDTSAPDVLEAAKFSLKAIDRSSNSMYKHALIRVVDAKVQIVSGKKYFLTLEIGESECTKNHHKKNCVLRAENSLNDECSVVVWDQLWLKKKDVLDVKCGRRSKRAVVINGPNDINLSMFEEFKAKYNRVYDNEAEYNKRFRIFRANLKKIETLQENEQGTAVYGPNMFADLTAKEFKQNYLGLKSGHTSKPSNHHMVNAQIPNVKLPVDFDWREHNAVTPVKNQGQCGSCWAFSVTGNIEGQWFLKHGQLISLSEQELVDCDKTDNGCNGGYMTTAYEAIEKLGGLEAEDQYPYDAQDETCKFNQSDVQVTVTSSVNITTNETEIAQWLVANGPISIGINANAMQFYMGGVSHPFKFLCNRNELDHGVLLVGYGVHRTSIRHKLLPYWLIKNSWGPHWGEKGYYRVYRGDGTCGVNQMASSAIVG